MADLQKRIQWLNDLLFEDSKIPEQERKLLETLHADLKFQSRFNRQKDLQSKTLTDEQKSINTKKEHKFLLENHIHVKPLIDIIAGYAVLIFIKFNARNNTTYTVKESCDGHFYFEAEKMTKENANNDHFYHPGRGETVKFIQDAQDLLKCEPRDITNVRTNLNDNRISETDLIKFLEVVSLDKPISIRSSNRELSSTTVCDERGLYGCSTVGDIKKILLQITNNSIYNRKYKITITKLSDINFGITKFDLPFFTERETFEAWTDIKSKSMLEDDILNFVV